MSQKIPANLFLLTITYSLLTIFAHAQSQPHGTEICSAFDPYLDKTPTIISLDGAAQIIMQTGCVQYFQVDMSLFNNSFRYITFEVNIQNSPSSDEFWPILLEKVGSLPELYFSDNNSVQDKADNVDILGYTNRKSYHNIVVDVSQGFGNSPMYFAMYQSFNNIADFIPESFTYTVTAKPSYLYPCPQDCSGNGECSQLRKQCVCKPGFFDADCGVSASFLDIKQSVSQVLEPNSWKYYYLNAKNYGGDIKLTVHKSLGPVYMAFLFDKDQDLNLPNLVIDQGQYIIASDIEKQSLTLLQNELRSYEGGVLMIGTYNSGSESILVNLQFELSDGNDTVRTALMFTMIALSVALLAIWAIFTIAKYKVYIQAQAMQRAHIRLMNQKAHLSKEDIEKYFPKKSFENMKSSFSQTLCSICLEDFKGETICRQLYCEHVYHDNCIELWLSNKDSCPNCKKEMTVVAIEEFLAGPKPQPEDQAVAVEEARPLNDYNPNSQPGSIVLDGADSRQGGNERGSLSLLKVDSKPALEQEELKVESIERLDAQEDRPDVVIELENLKKKSEV